MVGSDMASVSESSNGAMDYDVAIVGASLAGCASADVPRPRGRAGRSHREVPDPDNFKKVCSHFIQSSAVPTLERLELLEPIEALGATRTRVVSGPGGAGSCLATEQGANCVNLAP